MEVGDGVGRARSLFGADFFSILETLQNRRYTIKIFKNFDTFGFGGRTEDYLKFLFFFSIFSIEHIEKIEAHRKKMFHGQDWSVSVLL